MNSGSGVPLLVSIPHPEIREGSYSTFSEVKSLPTPSQYAARKVSELNICYKIIKAAKISFTVTRYVNVLFSATHHTFLSLLHGTNFAHHAYDVVHD